MTTTTKKESKEKTDRPQQKWAIPAIVSLLKDVLDQMTPAAQQNAILVFLNFCMLLLKLSSAKAEDGTLHRNRVLEAILQQVKTILETIKNEKIDNGTFVADFDCLQYQAGQPGGFWSGDSTIPNFAASSSSYTPTSSYSERSSTDAGELHYDSENRHSADGLSASTSSIDSLIPTGIRGEDTIPSETTGQMS